MRTLSRPGAYEFSSERRRLARAAQVLWVGLLFAAAAAAEVSPPGGMGRFGELPESHELVLANHSHQRVRIEFLDRRGARARCHDDTGAPRTGPSFPIAPQTALHCRVDPGRYHIRVHRQLAHLAEGSLWTSEEKTVDVK